MLKCMQKREQIMFGMREEMRTREEVDNLITSIGFGSAWKVQKEIKQKCGLTKYWFKRFEWQ